ncbi:synemin [Tachyglossus aculeatus]|uniref:synemin n=1 Tax=Tachyglossus aculeatus TaxID=9261 RepID=UPI0018F7401E|nr:synemin [Tachyglossus aculeatus]
MLYWGPPERDEKSQLQELNARLQDYVSRVRQLERENGALLEELAARRGREAERAAGLREQCEAEAAGLRRQLDRLLWDRELAAGERDALERELRELGRLGREAREARGRAGAELGELRRRLREARDARPGLEALLGRLQGERRRLLLEARRARELPLRGPAAVSPPRGRRPEPDLLRALRAGCALLAAGARDHAVRRYRQRVRELEEAARLGLAQRLRAEEERRQGLRELDALHRRARELDQLRAALEEQLLRLRDRYGLEVDESQRVIDLLEDEKETLTRTITDWLKEYQELVQVKTGLSLEVATYRALLEGESNPEILIWTEHIQNVPQDFRNRSYDYTKSILQKENERNILPGQKIPSANINSSALYSARSAYFGPQTTSTREVLRKDLLDSGDSSSATINQECSTSKDHTVFRTFSPTYDLLRKTESQLQSFSEQQKKDSTNIESLNLARELTLKANRESRDDVRVQVSDNSSSKMLSTQFPTSEQDLKQTEYTQNIDEVHLAGKEESKEDKSTKVERKILLEEKYNQDIPSEEENIRKTDKARDERSVVLGKNTDDKSSTEYRKHVIETTIKDKAIQDEKRFASKEKASEERTLRWEKLTKLDKETRERETMQRKEKSKESESTKEKHGTYGDNIEIEIPISFEGKMHEKASKENETELSLQKSPTSQRKYDDLGTNKSAAHFESGASEKDLKFKEETRDSSTSKMDSSTTETIAENIVASVLQRFVQPSDSTTSAGTFPDTEITYVERKEFPGKDKAKTEIIVESKVLEDIDISDEDSLKHLLSQDIKELDIQGKSTETMIEEIINLCPKGKDGKGKIVNVEIVEEPLGYVCDEKTELTPFEVEEVDDSSPVIERHCDVEEGSEEASTFSANKLKKTTLAHQNVTHVEEVTEAGDSESEQRYFVSTPEEYPLTHERDEGSVYGQIHIEEESTIKYSWQDEFSQSAQTRRKKDRFPGEEIISSSDLNYAMSEEGIGSYHSKEEDLKGDSIHSESLVIEKEIKISPEFQTSIKGLLSKDPKHQLVEAIEKLEGSLPESIREELSVLTKERQGDMAVDIKKVEQTTEGGSVTIVAEVNLSQTVDADQLNIEQLSKDEVSKSEKTLRSTDTFGAQDSRESENFDHPDGHDSYSFSSEPRRWASREIDSSSREEEDGGAEQYITEKIACQGPVSATVEVSSPRGFEQVQVLEDVNQPVRHIQIGPTEIQRTEHILYGGAEVSGEGVDLSQKEDSVSMGSSVRHFQLGPNTSQMAKEIIFRGPASATQEVGGSEDLGQGESSRRHITLGSKQLHANREIIVHGSISESGQGEDYSQDKGSVDTQTSKRYFKLDPKETYAEQVIFRGPFSDVKEFNVRGDTSSTEGSLNNNTAIRHIKIGSREFQTEQIIFHGPVSHHVEFSDSGNTFQPEGSLDTNRYLQSGGLDQKEFTTNGQIVYQGAISESTWERHAEDMPGTGEATDASRSIRHIKLSPTETQTTEQIVFCGPISKASPSVGSDDVSELEGVTDSSRSIRNIKLGSKETSFTFQMDVSDLEMPSSTTRSMQEATIILPQRKEMNVLFGSDDWKGIESQSGVEEGVGFNESIGGKKWAPGEGVVEKSSFEKTVELQRMVDQRSVISDEKKIAVLYLDKEQEEEEEDNDGRWF